MKKFDIPEKLRLPIAIAFSVIIFIAYSIWQGREQAKAAELLLKTQASEQSTSSATKNSEINNSSKPTTLEQSYPNKKPSLGLANVSASSSQIANKIKNAPDTIAFHTIENEFLKITISEKGAVIVTNLIKKSKNLITDANLEENSHEALHTGAIVVGDNITLNRTENRFLLDSQTSNTLVFKGFIETASGLILLTKEYKLDGYYLHLNLKSDANTGKLLVLNGSGIGPYVPDRERTGFDVTKSSYTIEEKNKTSFTSHDKKINEKRIDKYDFIAYDNRFYIKALTPGKNQGAAVFSVIPYDGENYLAQAISTELYANVDVSYKYAFLPKRRALLNSIYKESNIAYYTIFREMSFFKVIAEAIYPIILWLFDITKNMGVAIILVTLMLKIVTFPLQQSSMVSMQKMSDLSPKIKAIQDQHKKNPQKAQTEMMALYKREKINPLGGCISMAIPIPIFIALYTLFQNMLELNDQSFLWISNLALPDTIATIPFKIPFLGFDYVKATPINLLPIIMTVVSFLQSFTQPQSTTTSESQKTQMMMMKYVMPLMFLFISWKMPSGLVLYWTVQSIFSVIHTVGVRAYLAKKATTK